MHEDGNKEVRLQGISISQGFVIGQLHILSSQKFSVHTRHISESQIEMEICDYRRALHKGMQDLIHLKHILDQERSFEGMNILETQVYLLKDSLFTERVESRIREEKKNWESIVCQFFDEYKQFFDQNVDPEVRQRALDIKDIFFRVLGYSFSDLLMKRDDIPFGSILCSYEILPSCASEKVTKDIAGFITEIGGPTSHTSIIVKSRGKPYVTNICFTYLQPYEKRLVIVDGDRGEIIVNPTQYTIRLYTKRQRDTKIVSKGIYYTNDVRTKDGHLVDVQANIEHLSDINLLKQLKVQKIGLVRTELLIRNQLIEDIPEERQFFVYKELLQQSFPMEVVLRLFDIDDDKLYSFYKVRVPNPALGDRAIRFLLSNKNFLLRQIRAALRASVFGNMHILIPLVSDIEEVRLVKQCIWEERERLLHSGHSVAEKISVGCMLEVPASVIMCDQFALECDFFSIGTNDLSQYILAADRSHPQLFYRYGELPESLLRMIQHVVKEGGKVGIPVNICGDVASNPKYIEILLKVGIRSFSCPARQIPFIRNAICQSEILGNGNMSDIYREICGNEEEDSSPIFSS